MPFLVFATTYGTVLQLTSRRDQFTYFARSLHFANACSVQRAMRTASYCPSSQVCTRNNTPQTYNTAQKPAHSQPHTIKNKEKSYRQQSRDAQIKRKQDRADALSHNGGVTCKQYALHAKAVNGLAKEGISSAIFEHCTGNLFEHVVHKQAVDLVNQTFDKQQGYGSNLYAQSNVQLIAKLAHDSLVHAQTGDLLTAVDVIDLGYLLLDYTETHARLSQSIERQSKVESYSSDRKSIIAEQVTSLVLHAEHVRASVAKYLAQDLLAIKEIAMHPKETVAALGTALKGVVEIVDAVTPPGIISDYSPEQYQQWTVKRSKVLGTAHQAISHAWAEFCAMPEAEKEGYIIAQLIEGRMLTGFVKVLGECAYITKNSAHALAAKVPKTAIVDAASKKLTAVVEKVEKLGATVTEAFKDSAKLEVAGTGTRMQVPAQLSEIEKEVVRGSGKYELGLKPPISKQEIVLRYAAAVEKVAENFADTFRRLKLPLPDAEFFHHVLDRHFPGGTNLVDKKGRAKSIFNTNENFIELALEGWEKGKPLNERAKVYDFGRTIGKTSEGNATSRVRIVVNHEGSLLTMFPVKE